MQLMQPMQLNTSLHVQYDYVRVQTVCGWFHFSKYMITFSNLLVFYIFFRVIWFQFAYTHCLAYYSNKHINYEISEIK